MKANPENRERDFPIPPKSKAHWLDQVPSRLWFPIGFVSFFFVVGGWNQLASTWQKATGSPVSGPDQSIGLLLGSLVFGSCLLFGFRAWRRERTERQRQEKEALDWREDLRKHGDRVRFP